MSGLVILEVKTLPEIQVHSMRLCSSMLYTCISGSVLCMDEFGRRRVPIGLCEREREGERERERERRERDTHIEIFKYI